VPPPLEPLLLSDLRRSLLSAGYRPFTGDDLALCSCLNAGYLLRLSLAADLSDLSPINSEFGAAAALFGGVVAVFYRGYGVEETSGRMVGQKLDYLQANLLQSLAGGAGNRTRATISR
jgi:hypothetical protein